MGPKQRRGALGAALILGLLPTCASAEVPEPVYQQLVRIGKIVDVACTAKLYRPMMPAADYNAWWPRGAAAPDASKARLYPGIAISRDQKFGPHPKDLVDVFEPESGAGDRPVFIYVPGGGGNKIEQQTPEANAFYDNIGRWGVKNGFVVVTVQRHPGANWDDGGRDIAAAVDWVKANIGRHKGNGNNIVMAAHSAGNGPTGVYVAHPERWPNGVQIKGMIFMSGNPAPGIVSGAGAGGPPGTPGVACGIPAEVARGQGRITGPSGETPAPAGAGGPPPTPTPEQRAERDNLPGLKRTNVKIMLVRAELDPGVDGDMLPVDKAIRDALCALDGPAAREGEGRCPAMFYARRHSHVSEVFAFDSPDTSFSAPILAFARRVTR